MTRREVFQALVAAGVVAVLRPPLTTAYTHSPEEEDPMPSLMMELLELDAPTWHAIPVEKRHLLMAALYEAWGDDPDVIQHLSQAVATQDRRELRALYETLQQRARVWAKALECASP